MSDAPPKPPRGFATLSPAARSAAARKGGQSVPPAKRYFAVNPAAASAAGRVGGLAGTGAAKSRKRSVQP